MTKYLLFSGPRHETDYDIINKYLLEINARNLLYISFYRTNTANSFDTFKNNITPEVTCTEFHKVWDYKKGSLSHYDAIFFPGGRQESLIEYASDTEFGKDLRDWVDSDRDKLYIGSSAGTMMVGSILYNNYIKDNELLKGDKLLNEGFGIFPNTIFDVHFDSLKRHERMKLALDNHPEIKQGVGLDDDSAIIVEGNDINKRELIKGNIHVYNNLQ